MMSRVFSSLIHQSFYVNHCKNEHRQSGSEGRWRSHQQPHAKITENVHPIKCRRSDVRSIIPGKPTQASQTQPGLDGGAAQPGRRVNNKAELAGIQAWSHTTLAVDVAGRIKNTINVTPPLPSQTKAISGPKLRKLAAKDSRKPSDADFCAGASVHTARCKSEPIKNKKIKTRQ